MSWRDLVSRTGGRAGVPKSTAQAVLDAFLDEVQSSIVDGASVTLRGIGTLDRRWEEERSLRSIKDGRKMALDGRWRPVFRASGALREALREQTPQLMRDPAHQRAWRLAETLVADLNLYHAAAVPKDLDSLPDLGAVEARCAQALGGAWTRARRTWEEQTPAAVRTARDHLAVAARRRWGT